MQQKSSIFIAGKEALTDCKVGRGRPRSSWISTIKGDLKSRGLTLDLTVLTEAASNRERWRTEVVYGADIEETSLEEIGPEEIKILQEINSKLEQHVETVEFDQGVLEKLENIHRNLTAACGPQPHMKIGNEKA